MYRGPEDEKSLAYLENSPTKYEMFLEEWQEIRCVVWLGSRSQRTQHVILRNYVYPVGNLVRI